MSDSLQVWLDADFLSGKLQIGSLSKDRGAKIVGEITEVTRRWREAAARAKIPRADIELTATAFAQSDPARSGS